MKNLILFVFILLTVHPSFSQDSIELKQQKNQINFEVTDLINSMFAFSYERTIGKHTSFDLGFGYKTEDGLITFSGIDRDQFKTNDLVYTGFKIVPEFRYYLEKSVNGAMLSGFYFGAYLKYSNFKSDLIGTFISSQDVAYDIAYRAKIDVTSIGLMIGYKLPIGKHFFIDFLIAGPGSGSYKFNLKNTTPPPDEFYDVLNDALENYSLFDFINADFEFRDNKLRSNFSVVSFRYGISVGYSF